MQQQNGRIEKTPRIFYCVARESKTQSRARIFMKEAGEKVQKKERNKKKCKIKMCVAGKKGITKNCRMLLKGHALFFYFNVASACAGQRRRQLDLDWNCQG